MRIPSECLRKALLALLCSGLAPFHSVGAVIEVDFSRTYRDPAGRTHLPPHPAIEPVFSRINIWLPWARWDAARPSTLPQFEPHVREAALVMATGARPDGPFSVADLYRDSAGSLLPPDPNHPFFRTLDILKTRGIRPYIDIGPVPAALSPGRKPRLDTFEWNVLGPTDYDAWYRHIRMVFTYLHQSGKFTRAEMTRWGYQLLREPDNKEAWNPRHADAHAAPGNLDEYQRLYDCTLAGLRDAGLAVNLSPGNLMVPYAGVAGFKDAWTVPLFEWLASDAGRCPEHPAWPRFLPTADTLEIGFTAYGGSGGQIGKDPKNLGTLVDRFRFIAAQRLPVPVRISVGEGHLNGSRLHMRGEGTAAGAAWLASIFKASLDEGLRRYQTWGFVSADHISKFAEHGGLQPASAHVVAMTDRMSGGLRMQASVRRGFLARLGSEMEAVASRSGDALRILVVRRGTGSRQGSQETADILAAGLRPGRKYSVRHFRVDARHSSYMETWHEELAARDLDLPSMSDACMEHQFGPAHQAAWERLKPKLNALARLMPMSGDSLSWLLSDSSGRAAKRIRLPPDAVSLLELR